MKSAKSSTTPLSLKIILITGGAGAGKTTYGRKRCAEITALRFSIDDWMTGLFWMDATSGDGTYDWAMEGIGRAEILIRQNAEQALSLGVPVVLDLGVTKVDHRASFLAWAKGLEIPCELHWVDVPTETRWSRVQGRDDTRGETFAKMVPPVMFDFMENQWEAPLSDV